MDDLSRPLEGTTRTVTRPDGTALHTVSVGTSGRTVLLAHGYGFTADEWNLVAPELVARGLRVVAFDQRGHGRSTLGSDGIGSRQMASDYGAILEAYDAEDVVLVGHSIGGFVGLTFLLEQLAGWQRVGSLLLMATFAGDVNRDNLQNRVQIPLIQSGLLLRLLRWRWVARAFARTLTGEPFVEAYVDAFADVFRAQDHARLVPILQAFVDENRYPRLGELRLPCTVLVGSEDATTPPFHTADLHAGIAGSTLQTVPGKGHLLNWEAPDAVVGAIERLAAR